MSPTENKYLGYSWFLIWLALPLSLNYTVMFIWLFGIMVIYDLVQSGLPKVDKIDLRSALLFFGFLLWQVVSLYFDPDHELWWKTLEKKAAFLIIPLLLIFTRQAENQLSKWAFRGFFAGLTITGFILIATALSRLGTGEGWQYAYYHGLATALPHGAIYLSWYYAVALIVLVAIPLEPAVERIKPYLLAFFSIILLLLASKLFILLTIPYLAYKMLRTGSWTRRHKTIAITTLLAAMILSLPFLYRMSELRNTDFEVLKLEEYAYDTPF